MMSTENNLKVDENYLRNLLNFFVRYYHLTNYIKRMNLIYEPFDENAFIPHRRPHSTVPCTSADTFSCRQTNIPPAWAGYRIPQRRASAPACIPPFPIRRNSCVRSGSRVQGKNPPGSPHSAFRSSRPVYQKSHSRGIPDIF